MTNNMKNAISEPLPVPDKQATTAGSPKTHTPVIIVHGGAWAIPAHLTGRSVAGVELAARTGHSTLLRHGSALDAVEAAIKVLEDDPVFDAGHGSVLNAEGKVEMDAAVMTDDGRPRAGGVAAVSEVRNPIELARRVYETEHVLLVGEGAGMFAKEVGVETATEEELVSEEARAEWRRFGQYGRVVERLFGGCDTVGAVAMDETGVLAAGTSTGGITYKRVGRVGDSPIVGAGLYCENGLGAASTTGHGESILLVGLARMAVEGTRGGVWEGAREGIRRMKERTGGRGGVIVVDADGEIGWDFSTERMAWACVGKNGELLSGIDREEVDCGSGDA